jgi:hypothetical protein
MAASILSTYDESDIKDGGSDIGYWRMVADAAGTAKATPDDWAPMPVRNKYDMPNNSSTNKKTSESQTERTVSTKKAFSMTIDFAQFDPEGTLYTDVPDTLEAGPVIQIILERNDTPINGKKGYLHVFSTLTKRPTPGAAKDASFEFDLLACTKVGDYTLAVNVTAFPNFAGKYSIGSGGNLVHKKGAYFGMKSFTAS